MESSPKSPRPAAKVAHLHPAGARSLHLLMKDYKVNVFYLCT